MAIELKVPEVGESISEVQIGQWLKKKGDQVKLDENLVELETDKATVDLPSPTTGVLSQILKRNGDMVAVGDVIAYIEEGNAAPSTKPAATSAPKEKQPEAKPETKPAPKPAAETKPAAPKPAPVREEPQEADLSQLEPGEEAVAMTIVRRRIAARLLEAQQTAALLTTFNEVDMSAGMTLRKENKDAFQARHGVKLGFMSFFVKAVVDALKQFPEINAEIRGRHIIYRNFFHIGVAIGGERGLVVPVLRNAERLSFAEIEKGIGDFGQRAADNKLRPEELTGGTFTITNGGVFGSLLSTPIVNPPQSGILGMHSIQDRPVALNGQVVIRPMMYVALTYDHRIVDGRGAVLFLRRIKEVIEDPARMLIEV